MKKKHLIITALIVTSLLNLQAIAQKAIDLSFKPENGSNYLVTSNSDIIINQTMMGQEMKIDMSYGADMLYEILPSVPNKDLKMTYGKTKMNMSMMGRNISMDSENPDTTDALSKPMHALKGSVITATVSNKGEVVKITGTEELNKKLTDASGGNPQTAEMLKGVIGEKALKSAFEQSFKIYPDKPVKLGDSWITTTTIESTYILHSVNTYTLNKIDGNNAVLDVASKLSTNGAQKMETNGMEMNITLDGGQKGTMIVDIASGIAVSSQLEQALKGKIEVMGNEVPMTVSTKSKMNSVKK
jgi:hypothetical protein